MPRKIKKQPAKQPAAVRWEFDPDIPTYDFFENGSLDDPDNLHEAVNGFVDWLNEDVFLAWEAVACEEQGFALTSPQKQALNGLQDFNDEEDDRTLYINEMPRPSEPWPVILNKIAPYLLVEPFRTFGELEDAQCDGWKQIVTALRKHGQGLSLPPGVESPEQVVPVELRHKLWLQYCITPLGGLDPATGMTLADTDEHYRVDQCIEGLREWQESVAYFRLTLESLLTKVVLPERDLPIFLKLIQEKLGIGSVKEQIAEHL